MVTALVILLVACLTLAPILIVLSLQMQDLSSILSGKLWNTLPHSAFAAFPPFFNLNSFNVGRSGHFDK